jgi:hypothetical protein
MKKYLENAISKWYFNIDRNDLFPKKNIINFDEVKNDFKEREYSKSKYDELISVSNKEYNKLIKCFPIPDKKYISYDTSLITDWQLERLKKLYKGNNKESDIAKIVKLYDFVGMNNIHLSIPPIFKGIEMFGTPLNTHNDEFCSPFEIDKQFGSLGSVWDYKFHKDGIYLCDPPYDAPIIERIANKLNKDLDETKFNVAVLIVIPVWDSKSQKKLGIKDYGLDFSGYEIMINSKYHKNSIILDKFDYKYWSYYDDEKVPAVFTHYILLSKNKDININDYVERWKIWSSNKKTQIDCLNIYKNKIINSTTDNKIKRYLEKAISRWYFNVDKNDLLPKKNIVNFDEIENDIDNDSEKKKIFNESKNAYQELINYFPFPDIKYTSYDASLITKRQLDRLNKLYKGNNRNSDIFKLINLYNFIGMNSIHLSTPPIFEGIEMFGSPFNTSNDEYCSPFEIEKRFSSLGSAWDYKFHKDGIYLCNPPYDNLLIEKLAHKLNKDLDETKFKVAILVVIPVWDSKTQKELGIKDYGLDFPGYEIMIKSKYFKKDIILDQYKYKFWDYYLEKKIPAVSTHYILLSKNKDIDINDYVKKWKEWSEK